MYICIYKITYILLLQSLDDFSEDILLGIVVHEIIHALGFSRSLYDRLVKHYIP